MKRLNWRLLLVIAACSLFWAVVCAAIIHANSAQAQRMPMVQRAPERFAIQDQSAFCHFLTWQSLYERCGPGNLGCATVGGAQIWLAHPGYFPGDGTAVLIQHELAHANGGWSAAHED